MDIKDIAEQAYKNGAKDTLKKIKYFLSLEKLQLSKDFYIVYWETIESVLKELEQKI
jgi:hypothetical protein